MTKAGLIRRLSGVRLFRRRAGREAWETTDRLPPVIGRTVHCRRARQQQLRRPVKHLVLRNAGGG